ncbi:exonuclease subunit SbcD [Klebsiella sp. BIGb0407]|uniref:exonuclease subunit SbcD n=1 Tax=Klebsiella sp. BIGb0407 TaxID=2940603 RepID=UPI0021687646|nr:exonuclease subunit SbcD [Klebsiella sp. BIGb0407]MCS3432370.1 exonuclease SbcD [Klebsiella sp. BIGb0407]
MRIIHTSDWHLGQNFYTKTRGPEHRAFLNWLLEAVIEHQVDAVIVAGDIFDTGSPPSYAREIYNHFIVQLQSTGCQLIILAGNHDAVSTLNESRELLACLNTQVIARAAQETDQQAWLINKKNGQPGAILCPIPFLRPRDIQRSQSGLDGYEKQQSLMTAISEHYQQCYQAAVQLRGTQSLPIIATGHLTTVGATTSDAVRDIYIGSLDAFPADAFPPADYIALGHIHRPQKVAGCEHIRYSGSPVALSFDETNRAKSVFLVTFSDGKLASVEPLEVPVTQKLVTLKGSLTEINQQLEQFRDISPDNKIWLDIEVSTDEYLNDMQRQIQDLAASLPVEILLIRRSRAQRERFMANPHKETLSELSPEDVFERRLDQESLDEENATRLRTLFTQTLSSLHEEQELP